jgi:uncharacterized protein DUF3224
MPTRATGPFDVKLVPQSTDSVPEGAALGRTSIDKQLHGDLEATSKGEMLSAMTSVKGSAGYVAIERVTGMLHGRKGSFVLQHSGTMARGAQKLTITVVPDSGTGDLAGLSGTMAIRIETSGKHFYDFDYELASAGD